MLYEVITCAIAEHVPDIAIRYQQFINAKTAYEAGLPARKAPLRVVDGQIGITMEAERFTLCMRCFS